MQNSCLSFCLLKRSTKFWLRMLKPNLPRIPVLWKHTQWRLGKARRNASCRTNLAHRSHRKISPKFPLSFQLDLLSLGIGLAREGPIPMIKSPHATNVAVEGTLPSIAEHPSTSLICTRSSKTLSPVPLSVKYTF